MGFWNKNIEHLSKFIDFITDRLLCIIISIFIIILLTFLIFNFSPIVNPETVGSQQIMIFGISLDNLGIWFTAVGLISTAIWSMHQYTKSTSIRQQEKASKIAEDFANNLIEKMALISDTLLPNKEFQEMAYKVGNSGKLSQFTVREIEGILGNTECFDRCKQIILSKKTQKRYNKLLKKRYNEYERNNFNSYFPLLVENTLNHLEAICINISSKAAGSQFIYDSLHQTFLYAVEILAVKISSNNYNNIDKYFINIIQVYNMWNNQKKRDIAQFNKTQKKISSLQNKANKEVDKLLHKEGKTV